MEVPVGGRVVTPEDVLPPDEAAALKLVASASVEELVFAPPDSSHVKLPTGLLWEGELLRDVEVRELTGRDEELLARENKASAGFNALRFVDRILANTVVSVGGRAVEGSMLQNMLVGDRVYLSLAVRRLTYGAEWEVPDFLCRLCGKSNALAFDLNCPGTDIRLRELPDPTNQVVTVHIKRGPAAVRLVNGADELAAVGDGSATWPEQASVFINRCLRTINGQLPPPGIAARLSASDRKKIIAALGDNAPGPLLGEVSVLCSECGGEAKYSLSVADFFLV